MRLFLIALLLTACDGHNFRPEPKKKAPATASAQPSAHTSPSPVPSVKPDCIEQTAPLRFMFVLDHSYSMVDALAEAKSNIAQSIQNLKTVVPDVQVGMYVFADNPMHRRLIPLTADENVLKQELATIDVVADPSNSDGPEEALIAAAMALAHLTTSGASDMVSGLMIVSDNFAHAGGDESMRDYKPDTVLAALKGPEFKHFFLYDATPRTDPYAGWDHPSLPPYDSPADQWQKIRSAAQKNGVGFGFPFSSESFLTAIPKDLSTKLIFCEKNNRKD